MKTTTRPIGEPVSWRAYFALLHTCLERLSRGEVDLHLLRRVVAFETVHVSGEQGALVAGIFNVRNPAYLLSRLAQPNSADNPKYLPLVCPLVPPTQTSHLYRHYRRIPMLGSGGVQLFVCPPVESRDRPLSYSLIAQVFTSLTPRSDPWVHERSRALLNGVFAKLVARSSVGRIQLLDIACGSAKITMTLCKKASARYRKSFDLTLVDVVRGNRSIANAFFRNPSVFGNVVFRRASLFDWVGKSCDNMPARFDVALMLRACDVFSRFRIEQIRRHDASQWTRHDGPHGPVAPAVLRPDKLIEESRLDRIEHSIKQFRFTHGTAFHQFSLSSYFKAIHTIVTGAIAADDDMIYVPVRQFDDNALVLPNGHSLIGQLMTLADRMVIEDVDLSPCRLHTHIERFGLNTLRITDVTRRTRMRGASVCLIDRKGS